MKYQYWKCTICSEEFRTSTQMAEFDIKDHLKEHKKEYAEYIKAEQNYNSEVSDLEEKYKKKYLGSWIKNITPSVKKRPLWKCSGCGKEMEYYYRRHHISNFHNPACHRTFLGNL